LGFLQPFSQGGTASIVEVGRRKQRRQHDDEQ
jgi:hypothetical protein